MQAKPFSWIMLKLPKEGSSYIFFIYYMQTSRIGDVSYNVPFKLHNKPLQYKSRDFHERLNQTSERL